MATYKDLQDRIALDYLNRFDLIPEVKRAIAASIRCYSPKSYWFNQTATTIATTGGVSYLTVPSDYLKLNRMEISYSGSKNRLHEDDFDFIRTMNATSATGVPTSFCYQGDRWELAVIPNTVYNVTAYYQNILPVLSADTDTNAWTNEAFNLIAHDATLDVLNNVIVSNNNALINRHAAALQRTHTELQSHNAMRLTTRLRATSF